MLQFFSLFYPFWGKLYQLSDLCNWTNILIEIDNNHPDCLCAVESVLDLKTGLKIIFFFDDDILSSEILNNVKSWTLRRRGESSLHILISRTIQQILDVTSQSQILFVSHTQAVMCLLDVQQLSLSIISDAPTCFLIKLLRIHFIVTDASRARDYRSDIQKIFSLKCYYYISTSGTV